MLYIGSGTDSNLGVISRTASYTQARSLPRFMKRALDNGYHVAHVGLLCWTPMPPPGIQPRARALFLALEATFTVLLHACIPMITDDDAQHLLLWPRDSVTWEPVCSHLSLREALRGDLTMSPEELETAAVHRIARNKVNVLACGQRFRAKRRAADPVAYKRSVTQAKKNWATRNQDRVLDIAAKVRVKAKDSKRFYCPPCDVSLASQFALDKHKSTKLHKETAAGSNPRARVESASNIKQRAARAKRVGAGNFSCQPCDKIFPNDWSLQRHLSTNLHQKRCS